MADCHRLILHIFISTYPHILISSYPHILISPLSSQTKGSRRLDHLDSWLITESEGNWALWSNKWKMRWVVLPPQMIFHFGFSARNVNLRIKQIIQILCKWGLCAWICLQHIFKTTDTHTDKHTQIDTFLIVGFVKFLWNWIADWHNHWCSSLAAGSLTTFICIFICVCICKKSWIAVWHNHWCTSLAAGSVSLAHSPLLLIFVFVFVFVFAFVFVFLKIGFGLQSDTITDVAALLQAHHWEIQASVCQSHVWLQHFVFYYNRLPLWLIYVWYLLSEWRQQDGKISTLKF